MSPSDQRPKITVEDLLRLKRSERPAAEFWTNFERELRQKQLTALLEKRSWWQELPQLFARRAYLPIGATAILAFTLVSVKYYAPAPLAQVETAPAAGTALTVNHQSNEPSFVPVSAPVSSPLLNRSGQMTPGLQDRPVLAAAEPPAATAVELLPLLSAPPTIETPSSRSIAANLAHLEQSEPELVNAVMGSRLSAPARGQFASVPATELSSVPTGASRRSRILAQYTDRPLSPEPAAPDLVRERLSRRLGDNEIFDRLSRVGLKGDQVSLGLTLRL